MKKEINRLILLFIFFLKALFTFRKKVILFCIPTHPNLGDQAQLMCTEKWIADNFKGYKYLSLGQICVPFQNAPNILFVNYTFWCYIVLKMVVRRNDVFIGHSGYFFVDHHVGWFSYDFLLQHWRNKFIILPQTINFYTPVVKQRVSRIFGNKKNLILLCRDNVSYQNAKELFGNTQLLLYPDIVTSLIGTRTYTNKREGVLFCMRNDIEAYYTPEQIKNLMNKFGDIRKEMIDTTLKISSKQMRNHRDQFINCMIEKISTYKVVITDRYHGTIFSVIANTPVVVINSADHKLSSGVNWFPQSEFKDNIRFAQNLEDAYVKAMEKLNQTTCLTLNSQYFKVNYWDILLEKIQ